MGKRKVSYTNRKRKFSGNQYVAKFKFKPRIDVEDGAEVGHLGVDLNLQLNIKKKNESGEKPSTSIVSETIAATPTFSKQTPASRTDLKLSLPIHSTIPMDSDDDSTDSSDATEEEEIDDQCQIDGHRIIDVSLLRDAVESSVVCKYCRRSVKLVESKKRGLGYHLQFQCNNKDCDRQQPFSNCSTSGNAQCYSINKRAAFAMRCIGGDRAELSTFCGIMDLPKPVQNTTFTKIKSAICEAIKKVQD